MRVVHITDLFRPHNDPDDHWDLACQYALAVKGHTKLAAVMIDFPKPKWNKDPDVSAVAQLNQITGMAVPVMTGVPESFPLDADLRDPTVRNSPELSGVRALHRILRESPEPVVITVTGWCRDLVFIHKFDPELFSKKCAAVYLNAGLGTPDVSKQERLEWNVVIDPAAYAASFKVTPRLYWLPCFHVLGQRPKSSEACYGSLYVFNQDNILPELSDTLQNYFLSMYRDGGKPAGKSDWLTILGGQPDKGLLETVSKQRRCMWCTGGMLHMVGKTVLDDGSVVPIGKSDNRAVFRFRPIALKCDEHGRTSWQPNKDPHAAEGPFIFEVTNVAAYEAAMGKALKSLMLELGGRRD